MEAKTSEARLMTLKDLGMVAGYFLVFCLLGSFLLAGLALPVVGATGAVARAGTQLFEELPSEFEIKPPSEQSTIVAADGSLIAKFYLENRIVVDLKDIAKPMQQAVVAIEDHRFYEHKGIDVEGLMRAVLQNLSGAQLQGASTLTQQYVKNVLLQAGIEANDKAAMEEATARTAGRKLREAKLAISLEKKLTKDQILSGYLNIAQFGPSEYGVEASARHYFSKTAAELSIAEAALLAGMPQSPNGLDPITKPDKAKKRQLMVLAAMLREEMITQEEYDQAAATKVEELLHVQETPNGCAAAGNAAYFCSYVVNEILANPVFGKTAADRRQLLLRGGLTVTTTLDRVKQEQAAAVAFATIPENDPSGVRAAVVSVEPGSGQIKAMVQNTTYGKPSEQNPSATEVSFSVDHNHGGESGFQTGSTFKIFTLAQWYSSGRSAWQSVGGKAGFPASTWKIGCRPELVANFAPQDVGGGRRPATTVVNATVNSINTAYADMANQLDICDITKLAQAVGVTKPDGQMLDPHPASILGVNNATPLAMANAYAAFAASGKYCAPIAIASVRDRDGKDLPVPPVTCNQAVEARAANMVTATLVKVVQGHSGEVGIGRPAAGKTGTTDKAYHAWFVGYVPQLSTAVWIGHADGYVPMQHVWINKRYYSTVYGGTIAGPLWKNYMRQALQDSPIVNFPPQSLGVPPKPIEPEKTEEPANPEQPAPDAPAPAQSQVQAAPVQSQAGSVGGGARTGSGAVAVRGGVATLADSDVAGTGPSAGYFWAGAGSGNVGATPNKQEGIVRE